jgi:hypothetical protein
MNVRMRFEPRDLWVGVYWTVDKHDECYQSLYVYVCLLPCLPIRLRLPWGRDLWKNGACR